MTELEKYELVNKCETVEELAKAILVVSGGIEIEGRSRKFDAEKMSKAVNLVVNYSAPANILTRQYDIRQQALYIQYYN